MRRAYLDVIPGERRGVVTLDGRPERLLIERDSDAPEHRLGARIAARVRSVEPALRSAFLDLGTDTPGFAPLSPGLIEGAAVEVEIAAEPRRGKGAVVRIVGSASGDAPRLLQPAEALETRLQLWASRPPILGDEARDAADLAEEQALAVEHGLASGGSIAIERTRALTAVDVDLGAAQGDAGRAARRANLSAIAEAARLLRLKGWGGLVVIDLIGGGQAAEPLLAAAREAFAPDQPGVAFGPVSRFGLLQLAKPWRETPVTERLTDADGRRSLRALASDVVRALERAGRGDPGGRFQALCAPEVAALAVPLAAALGPRFSVRPDLGRDRSRPDIGRL